MDTANISQRRVQGGQLLAGLVGLLVGASACHTQQRRHTHQFEMNRALELHKAFESTANQ